MTSQCSIYDTVDSILPSIILLNKLISPFAQLSCVASQISAAYLVCISFLVIRYDWFPQVLQIPLGRCVSVWTQKKAAQEIHNTGLQISGIRCESSKVDHCSTRWWACKISFNSIIETGSASIHSCKWGTLRYVSHSTCIVKHQITISLQLGR